MALYRIGLLGNVTGKARADVEAELRLFLADLKLDIGKDVEISADMAPLLAPTTECKVAIHFGFSGAGDTPDLLRLVMLGIPVLPIFADGKTFSKETPPCLCHIGGICLSPDYAGAVSRITTATLECLTLLRSQRKIFLSYRRDDASPAAIQLYNALSARQFDVFLDTHVVRPGADFQEQLWHRLSDCDVMIMLDTPSYFLSKWTYEEFGRAEAKFLGILRVGWPGHPAIDVLKLGEDLQLNSGDLTAAGQLTSVALERIVFATERLRGKSTAVRHASLCGAFADAVSFHRGKVYGVGPGRSIVAKLRNGKTIVAFPALGIPTSESLYRAVKTAHTAGSSEIAVIYDHIGLHSEYIQHLLWLHGQISIVRSVWQTNAVTDMAKW